MVKQGKAHSASPVVISVALALVLVAGALVLSQQHKFGDDEDESDENGASEEAKRKWRERIGKSQKKTQTHTVEVCVSDVESARAAISGGATSLELCANRPEGGTTPSSGFIQAVVGLCKSTNVAVNVLVRPRPGDFLYSSSEFDVIVRDILGAKSCGVDGIVTGVLDSSGRIDVARMKVVRKVCGDLALTFHRAFDVMEIGGEEGGGLQAAVETVFSPEFCGCDRLLSSGRSSSAATPDGIQTLAKISALAAALSLSSSSSSSSPSSSSSSAPSKTKTVVAAAGISLANVASVIAGSGVQGVHVGSAVCRDPPLPELETETELETELETEDEDGLGKSGVGVHMGRGADVWLGAEVAKVEAFVFAAEAAWCARQAQTSSPLSPFSGSLAASTDLPSPSSSSPGSTVSDFDLSSSCKSASSSSLFLLPSFPGTGRPPWPPSPSSPSSPLSPSSQRSSGSYVMVSEGKEEEHA